MRVKTDLKLIYPLVSYERQYFIEDHYKEEARAFEKEIEAKKKEA